MSRISKTRIKTLERLAKDKPHSGRRDWTEEDEDVLREYYGRIDVVELAKFLGRTVTAMESKIQRMRKSGDM